MAYSSVTKPGDHFNTVTYAGNSSTQSITGVGFQPDWVWIKNRSDTRKHNLYDSVRGATKRLVSNDTVVEDTASNGLTTFGTDGFTSGSEQDTNHSGNNFVAWNWKAGTSFTNDASSTGIGTIDSTGSVSQTSGFSICTYTGNGVSGATIKHGLTTAPKIVIIKKRSHSDSWSMLNTNVDLQKYLSFNSTSGLISDPLFNNTAPTTSVFTVDSDGQVNGDTNTFVAYCFSEVKGFSKFGSYTGNNDADGPFIYTGFKPAFVIIKNASSTQNWVMFDSKRPGFNVINDIMYPNNTDAESNEDSLDFLSNGFKIRTSGNDRNGSGNTLIYMCFAEAPLVNSNGVPTNAG